MMSRSLMNSEVFTATWFLSLIASSLYTLTSVLSTSSARLGEASFSESTRMEDSSSSWRMPMLPWNRPATAFSGFLVTRISRPVHDLPQWSVPVTRMRSSPTFSVS